jgi:hypothetical protein
MIMRKKKNPFLHRTLEDYDPLSPSWQVSYVNPQGKKQKIGFVRRNGPRSYEVCRPQDDDYHSVFGMRLEADRWLLEHIDDAAVFGDLMG